MKKITVLLFMLFVSLFTNAQNNFEGIIKYKIRIELADSSMNAMTQGQMPTEMTQYIKGNKIKVEQNTPMMSSLVISDINTKESTVLIDMFGTKTAIKQSKDEFEKEQKEDSEVVVELTNETKEIFGYKCKKAIVKINNQTVDVFYNDEININNDFYAFSNIPQIKGLLFEYSINSESTKMKFEITEINKTQIKDSVFEISSEYNVISSKEFQKSLGF